MKTQFELMLPHEVEAAMARCATAFVPLGTIEWHGRQQAVGLDALKAHALCVRAAERGGGVVHPPIYGGNGGLNEPHTIVLEPENNLFSNLLRPWLEQLCRELARNGFRAVILLTGHYGAGQQILVRETAVRMTRILNIPVLGTPEHFLGLDVGYVGDHAGAFETSLLWYLRPELVDLDRLSGNEPYQGVYGRDPKKHASPEEGKRLAEPIVERLAMLARIMPQWDQDAVDAFARAEEALVRAQITLSSRTHSVWAAWQNVNNKRAFARYPQLLVEARFDEIVSLTRELTPES